ncbi:MAG: 3-hydroxyacyl-CoA dehydrogenase NAD-binding domain-containing protein [Beijerinckiaceae bacterium]|nr:3-hydroxyacyl-CoA dehydrogenase NAD-binding domain-containing protein [Beijerinckiaceae bacterium]
MSQRIAVIGAGTIGASWAALFLAHGHEVAAHDPSPNGEAFLRAFVGKAWPALEALGLVKDGASADRLSFHASIAEACKGVSFVQESGPEREDIKTATYAEIDAACASDVIIASSSSGLLISRFAIACKHPERCVIGHPFNPPHLIPLVEVVGGDKTSAEAISKAMEFYRGLGKQAIHIKKEVRGHVANRLQAAIWRETIHLVMEGVVSIEDADAALRYGPGQRWALMGQSAAFHLGGGEGGIAHFLSHIGPAVQDWMDDLGSPRLTPEVQKVIIDGVAEQANGRTIAELREWRDRKLIDILKVSAAP